MKSNPPSLKVQQFIMKEFDYINGELFRKAFSWTTGRNPIIRYFPRTLMNNTKPNDNGYIQINIRLDGKLKRYYLHHIVWLLCNRSWPTEEIDHANGDKLDNNILNLRLATKSQNHANSKKCSTFKGKTPSSKYKGVSWDKHAHKWMVQININKKRIYLGLFINENDAAEAYNKAAIKYQGAFAKINIIVI